MAVLLYLALAIGSWIAWNCASWYGHYRRALGLGLPVVLVPVGGFNPAWIVLYNVFPGALPLLRRLPFGLGGWVRYSYGGWTFHDQGAAHREHGAAFVVCTPAGFEIVLADAAAALGVLARRKEYAKPMFLYSLLNIFGPNVDALEGPDWQRHRRLTAPSLNERIMPAVWAEAAAQATQMLAAWAGAARGTRRLRDDLAALALQVWMKVGFGIAAPFGAQHETVRAPHTVSYREALFAIMQSFDWLVVLPVDRLSAPYMSKAMRRLGLYCREFKLYLEELVQSEKSARANGEPAKDHLLSTMVGLSEDEREANQAKGAAYGLRDDEILGNLFIYSFAGFETTANALSTAIAYLAAQPTWQDWLREEIVQVVPETTSLEDVPYEEAFPKLKRCLAVMYETQRLLSSVVFLLRVSSDQTQVLQIADYSHTLPPNTYVSVNIHGLHVDRKTWGDDADEWQPSRWITKDASGHEQLIEPHPGAYMPWSQGPHICPGKKFAQVEFASVLATLFRSYTVSPSLKSGESIQEARAEVTKMIKDAAILGPTNRMRDAGRVPLVWSKKT